LTGMAGWSRRHLGAGLAGFALAGCAHGSVARSRVQSGLVYLGQARVYALDPAGGTPVTLVDDMPTDGSRPAGVNDGIAVDHRNGQIYWTNMGRAAERDGYVMRCERDGSGVTTIVAAGGTFTPKQLKLDVAANRLYWSDREGMAIQRCNLDGTALETIVITGDPAAHKGDQARWCVGIALDP